MLVLSRKVGESVRIDGGVRVTVAAIQGSQVRLAIEAPEEVAIHREEIWERIAAANRSAARRAEPSDSEDESWPCPNE